MKQTLIFISMIIILVGCSSDSPKDRVMEIGKSYSVTTGNKVIKNSENALIKVIHQDGKTDSTIILLEGKATIIPK